jgi:hypothetical protein
MPVSAEEIPNFFGRANLNFRAGRGDEAVPFPSQ